MKIEILTDGATFQCTIDGKPFKDCDKMSKVVALSAFLKIEKEYKTSK